MDNEVTLSEDTKSDWLKLVKKHRKHQRGLPALSTLNTNAGNVEHNINMFNAMQPDDSISVDASNGNISSSCGMGESLQTIQPGDDIELVYEDLPIEIGIGGSGYFDHAFGNYLPDYDTKSLIVRWTYKVDETTVFEFLQDDPEVQLELGYDHLTPEQFAKKLDNMLPTLVEEHYEKLLDHFYYDAIEDAQDKYIYESVDSDVTYENKVTLSESTLDDKFTMSTRTLL